MRKKYLIMEMLTGYVDGVYSYHEDEIKFLFLDYQNEHPKGHWVLVELLDMTNTNVMVYDRQHYLRKLDLLESYKHE